MNKIVLFIMRILCLGLWAAAGLLFIRSLMKNNIVDALSTFLFAAIPVGVISGLLFYRYFTGPFAEMLVDGIFYPRKILKKVPLALSGFHGDLTNGHFSKVREEMRNLPRSAFRDPEVVYLYSQACMNIPGYEGEGLDVMENFFRTVRGRDENPFNQPLVFYYADTAKAFRSAEELCRVLAGEAGKSCYTAIEKKAIRTRISALENNRK